MKKFFANAYIWLLLLLLYAPIAIILIFSFTKAKVLGSWTGFSTDLYVNLFTGQANHQLNSAICNTIGIAIVAATLATILGTIAAIGIQKMYVRNRQVYFFLNSIPMVNPDIITGVSIFLLFVFMGITRGYVSIICAHVVFCTPYVVLNVMPRLLKTNKYLYDAALDLGATPFYALRKVLMPELKPGIISGFILSLTLSIDDFAVTLFTKGSQGIDTLSTFIYSDARKGGLTPELRPLFSIIFVVLLVLLVIQNVRASRSAKSKSAV